MVKDSTLWHNNPWWYDKRDIANDKWIKEWQGSNTRHVPGLKGEIRYDFEPSNSVVYSLRGPRQVGKTTLVKLQIGAFWRAASPRTTYCTTRWTRPTRTGT